MNSRIFLSFSLVILATLLVLLPKNTISNSQLTPIQLIKMDGETYVNVDLSARYVAYSDSAIQFIDVRTPEEFANFSIPGAINIPYENLLDKEWQGYFNADNNTNILFSNNMLKSSLAHAIIIGQGYKNNKVLKGGLNKWFEIVMNGEFKGGKISARENAIYQNRRLAKNLFIEYNSLPDSLRNKLLEAKYIEETLLDGGCE